MTHDLERQLHEHAQCVRSLAAALLGDHAAGDDVAQQTLLARPGGGAAKRAVRSASRH
ncbi:MAG TPA: hypothetical protein VF384_09610 [Planctomycetota bacterium]